MPRRVALYNGDNNALLEEVVVAARGKEGAGGGRVGRGLSPMTTSESNENKLAMAVELDHMYIGCSDTKASLEKDIEVQHLKNIILLHLDLIQQQADQLLAKDKQIKNLRDENDNVSNIYSSILGIFKTVPVPPVSTSPAHLAASALFRAITWVLTRLTDP